MFAYIVLLVEFSNANKTLSTYIPIFFRGVSPSSRGLRTHAFTCLADSLSVDCSVLVRALSWPTHNAWASDLGVAGICRFAMLSIRAQSTCAYASWSISARNPGLSWWHLRVIDARAVPLTALYVHLWCLPLWGSLRRAVLGLL